MKTHWRWPTLLALSCSLAACDHDLGEGEPDLGTGADSDGSVGGEGDLAGAGGDSGNAGGSDASSGPTLDAGPTTDQGGPSNSDGGSNSGDGGILWAHVVGGTGWDQLEGLALDSHGNLILAGQIENTVDVGCGPLAGQGRDILVTSFAASDGKCRWSQHFGGDTDDAAQALALGPSDEIYVGGHFRSEKMDLGGGLLPKLAPRWDAPWLAEFTPTATGIKHVWSTGFLGQGGVSSLALGPASSLLVTGSYYQSLQVVMGQQVARCCVAFDGMYAGSLAAATGKATWAHGARVTGDNDSSGEAATSTASQGNLVLVTGYIQGNAEFGSTHVTALGHNDGYLAAYAADTGALLWIRTWGIGGNTFNEGWRLLAEPGGTFLLTGTAEEGVDLGDGPLVGYGDHAFVERLDAQGQSMQRIVLYNQFGEITAMARRPDGRVVVVGSYRGTVNFGGTVLASAASGDPFMAVLSADLSRVESAETIRTNGEDFLFSQIVVGSDGTTYVGIPFVDWIELRGQHLTGTGVWDFLVAALP
jgi:hypothetical protein